jgi:putative isomerase
MKKDTMVTYGTLLRKGIFENTHQIFREPEGQLREPFLDPGAQYSKNLWDWDSYWASVALCGLLKDAKSEAGKDSEFRAKVLHHIKGSLTNFFDHQGKDIF